MATRYEQGGASAPSNVLSFAAARARQLTKASAEVPAWAHDIGTVCAYAAMLKADHDAETARIHYDAKVRGLDNWTGADDLRERTDANNHLWQVYCGTIRHLAALPASSRWEAERKRNTIGRMWLRDDDSDDRGWIGKLRGQCAADDHLLPPSLKLGRA